MSNICFIGAVPALLLAALCCSGLLLAALGCSGLLWAALGSIELRSINGSGDGSTPLVLGKRSINGSGDGNICFIGFAPDSIRQTPSAAAPDSTGVIGVSEMRSDNLGPRLGRALALLVRCQLVRAVWEIIPH